MAKLSIKKDSTSNSVNIFIQDSTSAIGAGKTGLVYNTANLACYYERPGAEAAQIALKTQTVTGAFDAGGFVEIDAANMPGAYRLDIPNDVVASGVNSAVVMLKGAAGMAPLVLELELVDNLAKDIYDIVTSETYGNSALKTLIDSKAPASTALSNATWTDTKAGYIDVAVSTRSTLTAQNVWEYATRTLSSFGSLVSDIATAVWGAATRTLSAFGFTVTVGANNDKTGYALTTAYDAAKTAASQASVNAIPTNPLLYYRPILSCPPLLRS